MATDILNFHVTLEYKDKDKLKPVIDFLLDNGCHNFEWDWEMGETNIIYRLTIYSTWAENLQKISQLCKDTEP